MDPEKKSVQDVDTTSTSGSSSSDSNRQAAPIVDTHAASLSRRTSRGAATTPGAEDPYEVLSRADTADHNSDGEDNHHADTAAAAVEPRLSHVRTATSVGTTGSRPADFEVTFDDDNDDDSIGSGKSSENPRNWPLWYRGWTLFCVSFSTWVTVLYSTNYTAAIPGIMHEFGVGNPTVATLGVTSYLMGLAVGSLFLAPLSELYGRRPVYIVSMVCFTVLVIPTGVATSLEQIIVARFFGAVFGAAMISNSPGTIVDISDEEYRAFCMSLFSIAPFNGPVTGPLIGGFVFQAYGWRWDNWLVLILGGAAALLMTTVKETYAPAILRQKAARRRKEMDDDRYWSRYDERADKLEVIKTNLKRPIVLAVKEPILWFFNLWISLLYGILYLCFVAYPIVFSQHRGWGPGVTGLAFVGIGIGTMLAIVSEPLVRRIINSHPRDPATGRVAPEASASIMVAGATFAALGQLGFAWTSLPATIHWAAPIAFGVPFGAGNTLCFIYGSSYLASAYEIYAASAMAGNAVVRSVFGATLPLAGAAMYAALTPQWAGTLLGLLEVLFIPIPWAFYKYGDRIRARSPVIRQMREEAAANESRRARQLARAARRRAREEAGVQGAEEGSGGDVEKAAMASGGQGV